MSVGPVKGRTGCSGYHGELTNSLGMSMVRKFRSVTLEVLNVKVGPTTMIEIITFF